MSMVGMQHPEVVAAIKAGGDETTLLVVDVETEEFFKRCNVLPTEEHVTGKHEQESDFDQLVGIIGITYLSSINMVTLRRAFLSRFPL